MYFIFLVKSWDQNLIDNRPHLREARERKLHPSSSCLDHRPHFAPWYFPLPADAVCRCYYLFPPSRWRRSEQNGVHSEGFFSPGLFPAFIFFIISEKFLLESSSSSLAVPYYSGSLVRFLVYSPVLFKFSLMYLFLYKHLRWCSKLHVHAVSRY